MKLLNTIFANHDKIMAENKFQSEADLQAKNLL
jgi:hypothetical protein